MDKILTLYKFGKCTASWIGTENIMFFGATTLAAGLYFMTPSNKTPNYYRFVLLKRSQPTKTIREQPYA